MKAAGGKKQARSGAGVAKYRDPRSGKTWTGFGRAPDWLATAKNRNAFLIAPGDITAATRLSTPGSGKAAGPRAASKAARKGAVKTASRKDAPAKKSAQRPAVKQRAGAKTGIPGAASRPLARSRGPADSSSADEGGSDEQTSKATPS